VRDREQPLDQRQPTVQVPLGVGVVDLQVNTLLLDRRGVPIREQRDIGPDARAEAGQREVLRGGMRFLAKPVNPKVLVDTIDRILAGQGVTA